MELLWSDQVDRSGLPIRRDLHARALAQSESLRGRSTETDMLRRLPDGTVDMLKQSGLARILQPARYGGLEAPLATMADVLVPIAAACGSTAWALAQYIMHNYMIARWGEVAQDRVWRDMPDVLVSGILIPRLGKATRVGGGYLLTGRWPLVTGVSTSDWCILSAIEQGGASARELYFLVPTKDVAILDTWYASGLKGSASNDVAVDGIFVEDDMTVDIAALKGGALPGRPVRQAAIYRLPVYMTFGLLLSGAALGMAEAMLAEYLGRAAIRTGIMSSRDETAATLAQRHVADAITMLEGVVAMLANDADRMTGWAEADVMPDDAQRTKIRANATFAGQQAWRAAQIIWDLAGSRGVYEPSVLGRAFRDISVATRHVTLNADVNLLEHGRVALGLPMTNMSL